MIKSFENFTMPECGTKSTLGCYNCVNESNCVFIKEVDEYFKTIDINKLTDEEKSTLSCLF